MSIFLDYIEPSIELNLYILQTFHALLVIAPYSMCTQLQAWDILCRCVIKYQTLLELYEREPKTKFIRWGLKGREEKNSNWPVAIINLFSTFPIRLAWTKRPDSLVRLLIQKKNKIQKWDVFVHFKKNFAKSTSLLNDLYQLREHKFCLVNMFRREVHWIFDVETHQIRTIASYLADKNRNK